MGTLSVAHIGTIIGFLWVLSWLGAIAFVGHNTNRTNTVQK
jgi:hypothetical protein